MSEFFQKLDEYLRPASIAHYRDQPAHEGIQSYFGGGFYGLVGEKWPDFKGKPMLPLLQVVTEELPYCPVKLQGIAAFTVFIRPDGVTHNGLPDPSGHEWVIRTYKNADGLSPLPQPKIKNNIRQSLIQWERVEGEGPDMDDAEFLAEQYGFKDLFQEFDHHPKIESPDVFYEKYINTDRTKIGGWPHYIQYKPVAEKGGYIFQIGSEMESTLWGDFGNAYFYLNDNGAWYLDWQCH